MNRIKRDQFANSANYHSALKADIVIHNQQQEIAMQRQKKAGVYQGWPIVSELYNDYTARRPKTDADVSRFMSAQAKRLRKQVRNLKLAA